MYKANQWRAVHILPSPFATQGYTDRKCGCSNYARKVGLIASDNNRSHGVIWYEIYGQLLIGLWGTNKSYQEGCSRGLESDWKPITINIMKVGGDLEEVHTQLYRVKLQSLDDQKVHNVSAVGLECINSEIEEVNLDDLANTFRLNKNSLHRGSGSIDVLIGIDHEKFHEGPTRHKGSLIARQSPLGWVIFGATSDQQMSKSMVMNVMLANPVDMTDFWTTESMGVCHDPSPCSQSNLSRQEIEEYKLISESCQKVGNQWLVPYPWRKDPRLLPDNKRHAERMLYATEKKLAKHPEYAEAYGQQMSEMVEMGFARKLDETELSSHKGPVHYVSHHAVVRPEKKSTPVRILFNSSAVYLGT